MVEAAFISGCSQMGCQIQPGVNFKRAAVSVFGYEVAFAEAGTGETIISLPGSAGLEMSKAKDILARDYRVIEFNPPGWGDTPILAASMKQRHLAILLAAAIEELPIDRYMITGTSLGGVNALWLAQQFPDRVSALALEAPRAFYLDENLVNPEAQKVLEAIRAGELSGFDPGMSSPPTHPLKPLSDADYFHEQMRRRYKMFRFTDTSENWDLEPLARSLTIPTTIVFGTEDEILNQSYPAQLASIMPNLRVKIAGGANHDIQNTGTEAFVEAVRAARS